MCFMKMPKVKEPPAPPNKLDNMNDALRAMQMKRAGGTSRMDTNVTQGTAGNSVVASPAAGSGGKTILGG